MIAADDFLIPAREAGITFFTGVPCSFLTPIINRAIGDPACAYVAAQSEGEAVAIAAGAWLAGRGTAVMCQNSGLGNAVNPLTSLNYPFRIPTLLIVTWRGAPGLKDEPQHELMGHILPSLLDVMRVPHRPFPRAQADVGPALKAALDGMNDSGLPFALVMEKGAVRDDGLDVAAAAPLQPGASHDFATRGPRPTRAAVLERLLARVPGEAALIATTGFTGRELFTLADRPQHLYQVGSMGCCGAMALGVALHCERPVVAIDGDGAALMKLGAFATIGAYGPKRLVHLVLDNESYESTGGQPTVSGAVDFAAVALACGYRSAARCDSLDGFERAVALASDRPGPHLIHMKIAPGAMAGLGRPGITPAEVARRFRALVCEGAPVAP